MPYQNSFYNNKIKFQGNSWLALQRSINSIKFIKWDWQCYSRGRSNFQEKPRSRLTRSIWDDWIGDKQEKMRPEKYSFLEKKILHKEHSFLEKEILHKRENRFTMNPWKYHITWWIVLWSNRLINFTKYFFIPQNV